MIKDGPNGNNIGTADKESEFGVFDSKEVSGKKWLKVNHDYDWWVNEANFEDIAKFSDR